MWMNVVLVSGVCLVVGLVTPSLCDPSIGGNGDGNVGRPSRPQVFTSPEELRTYLEQLSNYFAIAGRPRFGKRFAPSPQYRPTLKQLFNNNNNNNNVNNDDNDIDDNNNNFNNKNMKVGVPSAEVVNYRYPSPKSDLYQLLYQYDD